MFAKQKTDPDLQVLIDTQLAVLSTVQDVKARTDMVDQIIKLKTLQSAPQREKVSADVLATIAANLAGILIIVNHERAGVVASKALGFVQKLR